MNESLTIDAPRLLGAAGGSSGNAILQFVPFLVLGGLLYFLMIRPQRKRQQQVKEMQASLGVGDEVITTSGIYGFIAAEDDQCFWLLIDDEVEIRIARAAIQGLAPTGDDGDKTEGTANTDEDEDDVSTDDTANDAENDGDDTSEDVDPARADGDKNEVEGGSK